MLGDERCFPANEIRRIHAAQLAYLLLRPEVFDARVRAGRVIDGHGDLRPEHVYLSSPPAIIDCIEFNAEFRQVDVLDELSFLETECALFEAKEIGLAIREQCSELLGDETPMELSAFYQSYRACVRAKVAVLRGRQLPAAKREEQLFLAQKYLGLADPFDAMLGPPLLIVVCGLSGTGKSTIARALGDRLAIGTLETDAVRQELVNEGRLAADSGSAKYSAEKRQQVYDEMLAAADELLAEHGSAILDGTFLSRKQREQVAELAERRGARWLIVHCRCPVEIAAARIAARLEQGGSFSEARPELVEEQMFAEEPDDRGWPAIECDTTRSTSGVVQEIIEHLAKA